VTSLEGFFVTSLESCSLCFGVFSLSGSHINQMRVVGFFKQIVVVLAIHEHNKEQTKSNSLSKKNFSWLT
jgi:hypothetical protein